MISFSRYFTVCITYQPPLIVSAGIMLNYVWILLMAISKTHVKHMMVAL